MERSEYCFVVCLLLFIACAVTCTPNKDPRGRPRTLFVEHVTLGSDSGVSKCGPCEWKYGLCEGQTPKQGPYESFVEDGVTVHCNAKTGHSIRYQCAYECTELQNAPSKLACTGCSQPVAYLESLGKDCPDIKYRYGGGLFVAKDEWYASFWQRLTNTCTEQLRCRCVSEAEVDVAYYYGKVATVEICDGVQCFGK